MNLYNNKKPWYELYSTIYCSGIIFINDVPVQKYFGKQTEDKDGTGGGLVGQTPINHVLLQSGKYKVQGVMFPRYGKQKLGLRDVMIIEFNLSEIGRWKETLHNFHPEIESPGISLVPNDDPNAKYANKQENPIEGLPSYFIETEIDVEVPYVLDGWQNSLNLKDIYKDREKELKKEVLMYFRQIHALLQEHNVAKFWDLSREKEELQAQAFYFDSKKREEIKQSIVELFHENLEVLPLQDNELKLEIFGYGKLVSLSRLDGTSALQFKSPNLEKESNIELDVKLHIRTKEKGFSII